MNIIQSLHKVDGESERWLRIVENSWSLPPDDIAAFIMANDMLDALYMVGTLGDIYAVSRAADAIAVSVIQEYTYSAYVQQAEEEALRALGYLQSVVMYPGSTAELLNLIFAAYGVCVNSVKAAVRDVASSMHADYAFGSFNFTEPLHVTNARQERILLNKQLLIKELR